jgi:methylmalonyl-CoA mutase C-terminal domain/subunit
MSKQMIESNLNHRNEFDGHSGKRKIRVLLAKSRMDAHDRGVRYVAKELSNAGMEAIFTRYALPEEIVETAIQEAVDIIGVSSSTGGHLYVAERIHDCLIEKDVHDMKVIFGGIIANLDIPKMKKIGVEDVFGPGSSIMDIIQKIESFRLPKITSDKFCNNSDA